MVRQTASISYFKEIKELLKALKTFTPQSNWFHIHRHEEVPETHSAETQIFRSDTFAASLLIEGSADYKIGMHEYNMSKGSFYFMSPRHLRYYKKTSPWKGFVFLFSNEFIRQFTQRDIYGEYPFFQMDANVQLRLNQKQLKELTGLLDKLLKVYQSDHKEKYKLIYHYLSIVLLQSKQWHFDQHQEDQTNQGSALLSKSFYDALENHFFEIASQKAEQLLGVSDFAAQLNVSTNYLSDVVKKETGKTATQIIKERTILEAKSLLKSTELSVSEIAYFLLFQDSSYFAKYFKSATQLSPTQFRDAK